MTTTQINLNHFGSLTDVAILRQMQPVLKSYPNNQYAFAPFFHPFVGDLIGQLNQYSVADMLAPSFLSTLTRDYAPYYTIASNAAVSFPKVPAPNTTLSAGGPYSILDVASDGPYSVYNWELLYHIPVSIAIHLSSNQRFAEAQQWFELVFDPSFTDSMSTPSIPFWKCFALRVQNLLGDSIALLGYTGSDPQQLKLRAALLAGYDRLMQTPFDCSVVARSRPQTYEYFVVMKYLDNLIAWGDSLFLQDTIETLNEATLCYVLAANLLGPRPERVPSGSSMAPKAYADLKKNLDPNDPLGVAMVQMESQFPFLIDGSPSIPASTSGSAPLFGTGSAYYFCIPPNSKLLGYWDIVADRLFKIRHCENIAGVVQQLPLFDPPINPDMLSLAGEAGIDVATIVSGLYQPVGPLRSLPRIQKALELAAEVRALGNALLSAIEKGDNEHLAQLRQTNEVAVQQLTQNVRFLQLGQAKEAIQSLLRTRSVTLERYKYYLRLLGQAPDGVPDTFTIDDNLELNEDNWDDVYDSLVSQYDTTISLNALPTLQLAQSSPLTESGLTGAGQLYLNQNENAELNVLLPAAQVARTAASEINILASVLTFIPEFNVDLSFWGLGADSRVFGGSKLSDAIKVESEVLNLIASISQDQAGMASRTASYQRRADDWMQQANLAARELMQIGRQLIGSIIAQQVAKHEYELVMTQLAQAQGVQSFLQDKFSSEQLYLWMQSQLSGMYYQFYRLAIDTAHKAEQTMKQELMRPELDSTTFVQFDYWNTGRQGLLSGDSLYLDVKRMEQAYHDNNKRELEITRHVSLRQLNPMALINLRLSGTCTFSVPEWFFDRDCPGNYLLRSRSLALTMPSVIGPYSTINCRVTQQSSKIRVSSMPTSAADKYSEATPGADPNFLYCYGSTDVIVTSSGANDSGMHETNLRDERFLPFEGLGIADSTWRLDLPSDFRSFDYTTIPDVILHLRYTARYGGDALAQLAQSRLKTTLGNTSVPALSLLFMLRSDFPSEWAAFVTSTATPAPFTFTLRKEHFPYFIQNKKLSISALTFFGADATGTTLLSAGATTAPASVSSALASAGSGVITETSSAALKSVLYPTALQVYLVIQYSAV